MLAPVVVKIAARLFVERMEEEFALQVAGNGHSLDRFEVLARILLVPGRASGRQRLQA